MWQILCVSRYFVIKPIGICSINNVKSTSLININIDIILYALQNKHLCILAWFMLCYKNYLVLTFCKCASFWVPKIFSENCILQLIIKKIVMFSSETPPYPTMCISSGVMFIGLGPYSPDIKWFNETIVTYLVLTHISVINVLIKTNLNSLFLCLVDHQKY